MKKICVGYIRVSTTSQVDEGVSLDAQKARIEAWAMANDFELVSCHVDAGLSGGRANNRPALQAALNDACKQRAVFVVYSLSRMSRSIKDTLEISERLNKSGADLVSLSEHIDTTSAAGRMIFNMLSVLNQFERDVIAERTTTAMTHLRMQGKRISGEIPYGHDLDGEKLIRNDQEQATIEIICGLRLSRFSLRKISAELQRRGIKTKTGNAQWAPKVIAGILKRNGGQAA